MSKKIANTYLEATIIDPTGREWTAAALHLSPHAEDADETRREKELKFVLESLADDRRQNRPHILCGDFNSNAATQQIDPQQCKPATRKAWQKNGGNLPRRAIQKV